MAKRDFAPSSDKMRFDALKWRNAILRIKVVKRDFTHLNGEMRFCALQRQNAILRTSKRIFLRFVAENVEA